MTHKYNPTLKELKKQINKKGVKVYGIVQITQNDTMPVELKKNDFLIELSKWNEEDFEENLVCINSNGDIFV